MKTLKEFAKSKSNSCFIVKKGSRYLTVRSGELAVSQNQIEAVCFDKEQQAIDFINAAIVDDRNARVVGRNYFIVPISKTPFSKR